MSKIQNMIDQLLEQKSELTREIIEQKIVEKKEKISLEYLTDEGALFLIAFDYGVTFHGFGKDGIHEVTGTKFDEGGFGRDGIHEVTGTKFDEDGFDKAGYNKEGFLREGYDVDGNYENGFHWVSGIHKITGTVFDENGKDNQNRSKKERDAEKEEEDREANDKYMFELDELLDPHDMRGEEKPDPYDYNLGEGTNAEFANKDEEASK